MNNQSPAYQTPEELPFQVIEREFLGNMKVDLITDQFVYFVDPEEGDENGNTSMHRNEEGLPLVTNNYFAYAGLWDSLHDGEEELLWIGEATAYYMNQPEYLENKAEYNEE